MNIGFIPNFVSCLTSLLIICLEYLSLITTFKTSCLIRNVIKVSVYKDSTNHLFHLHFVEEEMLFFSKEK